MIVFYYFFQALVERDSASQANLMIAVVIVSAFLIVVIALALLILLYRAKNGELSLKHKRFLGSPTASDSRNASQVWLQTYKLEKTKKLRHTNYDVFDSPPPLCHALCLMYLCHTIPNPPSPTL